MPTTVNLRPVLDRPQPEMCAPSPANTAAGSFVVSSNHYRQRQLLVLNATTQHLYDPAEDGYVPLPSAALPGTFGAGACGAASSVGPTGTATGGTSTTVITALTLATCLRGYKIHITAGPGAGETREIARSTVGANATITVTSAFSTPITSSSVFRLLTPRWYVAAAGSTAAGSFRYYDLALGTWTTLANLPVSLTADSRLVSTPSYADTDYVSFDTGTATTGGASTLSDSLAAWTVNQWANYQIRIVSGTGAGQIRTVASNTSTQITVSAAWAIQPDATSVYSLEGNDDYLYLLGNGAVTLYRYSVSLNTFTTLSPSVARSGAPGAGLSGHWVSAVTDSLWTDQNAIINGRRIYSFRGGGSTVMDYYDIPSNAWVNAITYAPVATTINTGAKYVDVGNSLYIATPAATGAVTRWARFDYARSVLEAGPVWLYPNGAALVGDTAFNVIYTDGATKLRYLYMILSTSNILLRQLIIPSG